MSATAVSAPRPTAILVTANEEATRRNRIAEKVESLCVIVTRVVDASKAGKLDYSVVDLVLYVLDGMLQGPTTKLEAACERAERPLFGLSHQRSGASWEKLGAHVEAMVASGAMLATAAHVEPEVSLNTEARPRVLQLAAPAEPKKEDANFYREMASVLNGEVGDLQKKLAENDAAHKALAAKLEAANANVEALERRNEELRRKLAEAADSKTDVVGERAQLRARVKELEDEVTAHRQQAKNGRELLTNMTAERDELRAEVGRLGEIVALREGERDRALLDWQAARDRPTGGPDLGKLRAVIDSVAALAEHGVVDLTAGLAMIRKVVPP